MPPVPVAPPGESPMSPCEAHGCSACCHETEMLLTEADVRRLEARGYAREAFVRVDADGYAELRNVDGRCTFLGADGRCTVYADRPEGCRHYPIILDERWRVIRDVDCPHRSAFPVPAGAERRLRGLIRRIERERARRNRRT